MQTTSADNRFYPVDGDYFVLRYSEAITLNVVYLKFSDQSSKAVSEEVPITA